MRHWLLVGLLAVGWGCARGPTLDGKWVGPTEYGGTITVDFEASGAISIRTEHAGAAPITLRGRCERLPHGVSVRIDSAHVELPSDTPSARHAGEEIEESLIENANRDQTRTITWLDSDRFTWSDSQGRKMTFQRQDR